MENKIRILHVQETIGSGGVERRRLSLAKHLDKTIFDQKFICTNAAGNIPEEIRAEGFEVIPIGILKSPFHWDQHRKVQKIIDDYQPDIVHGAVFEGVTMAALNGWIKRVPVIIIEETSYPLNRTWRGNLLMKCFSLLSDKVIGVSPAVTMDYLLEKLKVPKNKVVLINNGVALPRNISEDEIHLEMKIRNIDENNFVIGSVGRMFQDENKRFSDLIKAFAKFSENKNDVKLLLIGEGRERALYENLTRSLHIENKVIFAGYQSDVALFYRMMNVFSLVSTSESFGLVLVEAMLAKLPVVATRVGGMKDIVNENETGILVTPGDIEEISSSFERLYQNQPLRIKMGEAGYNKAKEEYTETVYTKKISDLYLSFKIKNAKI